MNNKILGDKRKSNFDDNLPDLVNAIFEKENKENKTFTPKKIFLEPLCALDKKLTQDEWFEYWTCTDEDYMASMADFYYVFKQLKHQYETGSAKEKSEAHHSRDRLLTDMHSEAGNNGILISSTRIMYDPENLKDKIIHHYDCKNKEIVKEIITNIPVCRSAPIEMLDMRGTEFLQALFDTNDDLQTIIRTLEFISGMNRNRIKISTPPMGAEFTGQGVSRSRKKDPVRFAGFTSYHGIEFEIVASNIIGNCNQGFSRGVRYE